VVRQLILRPVTRGVHVPGFHEEGPQAPTAPHVEQPRGDVGLAGQAVRATEGIVGVTRTELIEDRRLEREGARAPARAGADRVPPLLVGRGGDVGVLRSASTREARRERRGAEAVADGAVADRRASGRRRVALEPGQGVDGTKVEALEGADLDAEDRGEVVTAVEAGETATARARTLQTFLDLGERDVRGNVRGPLGVQVEAREV